jgi:uracil permease
MSIGISFLAPISQLISIIPKPVIGGVEIILFSLIAINGLKLLINYKVNFSKPKNIIIFSLISVMGLGGAVFNLAPSIALSGTGVAILISIFLNILLPDKKDDDTSYIQFVDLAPSDITQNVKIITKKSKKMFDRLKKKKDKKDKDKENT